MNNEKFKAIITNLKELRKLGLEFDDNMLLDSATKIYNTEIINESKNTFYKTNTSAGKGEKSSSPNPATKRQLDYIYKNNLDVNTEGITKKQAFEIIKKHKENG